MYGLINKNKFVVIFIAVFVFSSILLHRKSYNQLPFGVHALQQSDHYALALGFLDNGLDFFHPASFSLDLEFPAKRGLNNPQGITAVDFPILHYAVAIIMNLTNTRSPIVFRFVTWLSSFIALLYFFRTIKRIKGFSIAIFLCGFIMFQPVYCYYQNGFHVSSTAFNSFLIGISFQINYFDKGKYRMFIFGMLFLTLAALMRFIQIIPVLAFFCMLVFNSIRDKEFDRKIFVVIASMGLVFGYFGYNIILSNNYGSVFLNHPRIADSVMEFLSHVFNTVKMYSRGFLPILHMVAFGTIIYIYRKNKKKLNTNWQNIKIWILFSFIGNILFSVLMSFGISYHDYYALDTWMPLIILFMVYAILLIDFSELDSIVISTFVAMFLIGSFAVSFETQNHKYHKTNINGASLVINDFKESENFLNVHVDKKDRTLIICGYGWNTPMIGWQRKSFRVANHFEQNIPSALEKGFDKIITHDATFKETILDNYQNFNSKVEYISGNGKVTIWSMKDFK